MTRTLPLLKGSQPSMSMATVCHVREKSQSKSSARTLLLNLAIYANDCCGVAWPADATLYQDVNVSRQRFNKLKNTRESRLCIESPLCSSSLLRGSSPPGAPPHPRPVSAPATAQAPPCVNWPQLGMTREEVIAVWGMPRDRRTDWVSETRLDHWSYRRSQLDPKSVFKKLVADS
jgi:hypothetical protein